MHVSILLFKNDLPREKVKKCTSHIGMLIDIIPYLAFAVCAVIISCK